MKLYQWSWLSGMTSYIVLGVLRRSSASLVEPSFEMQSPVTLFLVILLAGIGTILGIISWRRKEANAWWTIIALVLNAAMLLAGLARLFSS